MRAIMQRVSEASVSVDGLRVSAIKKGLFVLIGIKEEDSQQDAEFLAEKLTKLRIMADRQGKMNLAVGDVGGAILVVSQFTLYANTSGGNRPSFSNAAKPEHAQQLYDHFINQLKARGLSVETGRFGAYMKIDTTLDGPVTILMES